MDGDNPASMRYTEVKMMKLSEYILSDIDKNDLVFTVGKRGTKNLENCPHVTMLWPPKELGGYSLIIDGIASKHENFDGSGSVWKISFDSGILHRPAQNLEGNDHSCGSDCQTI